MNNQFFKMTGIAMILGAILMVITMVLHPTGGSIEHLFRIMTVNILAHSIGIASVPIMLLGFWGMSLRLEQDIFFSRSGLAVALTSLMAVMIAAALNGLVLPFFIQGYRDASAEVLESIRPILHFNFALNLAFDYIFIVGICLAILLWSIAIIHTRVFPKWLGFAGIALVSLALILLITGFNFADLVGFRIFIFGLVTWIILAGIFLWKSPPEKIIS